MEAKAPTNERIAQMFVKVADLLEIQGASPHRVRAWRCGAAAIREQPRQLADLFAEQGRAGLEELPHIGHALAAVTIEILWKGRSRLLDRLQGETSPFELFADLPAIGEILAERIYHELGIETLEELELAAHDGRLTSVSGFGSERVRAVQNVLAARLSRIVRHPELARSRKPLPVAAPSISALLAVDDRYRRLAGADQLRRIAPRRFNPGRVAWLPILHDDREGWSFSATFSNTPLAHQLGKTGDWVVVHYERPGVQGHATIVTEASGPLRARRVVRGRETECQQHHGLASGHLAPASQRT